MRYSEKIDNFKQELQTTGIVKITTEEKKYLDAIYNKDYINDVKTLVANIKVYSYDRSDTGVLFKQYIKLVNLGLSYNKLQLDYKRLLYKIYLNVKEDILFIKKLDGSLKQLFNIKIDELNTKFKSNLEDLNKIISNLRLVKGGADIVTQIDEINMKNRATVPYLNLGIIYSPDQEKFMPHILNNDNLVLHIFRPSSDVTIYNGTKEEEIAKDTASTKQKYLKYKYKYLKSKELKNII